MTLDRGCGCVPNPWPEDCEAYVPLDTAHQDTNVIIVVPEQWCAREFTIGEVVRVGDRQGRRALATVADRLTPPDEPTMKCFGFIVERLEETA